MMPPTTGAPSLKMVFVATAIVCVGIALVLNGMGLGKNPLSHAPPPTPDPPLPIRVTLEGLTTLQVENYSTGGWNNCSFTLNDDYQYKAAAVPAGGVTAIPLLLFTKTDGLRFRADAIAPQRIYVQCGLDAGGWGDYSGKW